MKKLLINTLLFISLTSATQAVIWNENISEEEVLEKAQEITSVVQVLTQKGENTHTGSGAIISTGEGKTHILTARHVIFDKDLIYVLVELGNGIKKAIRAKGYYIDPKGTSLLEQLAMIIPDEEHYSSAPLLRELTNTITDLRHHTDIAIIELEEEIDTENITIAPLCQETPESLSGTVLHGAGYGKFGPSNEATPSNYDGKKRYYEIPILSANEPYSNSFNSDTPLTFGTALFSSITQNLIAAGTQILATDIYSGTLANYLNIFHAASAIATILTVAVLEDAGLAYASPRLMHLEASHIRAAPLQSEHLKFYGSASQGDSGSPVFDRSGKIAAVVSRQTSKGDIYSNSVYYYLNWIERVLNGEKTIAPLNPSFEPNEKTKASLLNFNAFISPDSIMLDSERLYKFARDGVTLSEAALAIVDLSQMGDALDSACYDGNEKALERLIDWGARLDGYNLYALAKNEAKLSEAALATTNSSDMDAAIDYTCRDGDGKALERLIDWGARLNHIQLYAFAKNKAKLSDVVLATLDEALIANALNLSTRPFGSKEAEDLLLTWSDAANLNMDVILSILADKDPSLE